MLWSLYNCSLLFLTSPTTAYLVALQSLLPDLNKFTSFILCILFKYNLPPEITKYQFTTFDILCSVSEVFVGVNFTAEAAGGHLDGHLEPVLYSH
mgnify:CR=1 FL=1